MRRVSFLLLSLIVGIAGCAHEAAPSRVEGRVTDADGAQTQSFGGSGTTSAATGVQAMALLPDGSLELIAEGEIEADGAYGFELPAGEEHVILQAVDASGEVLAAAVLEHSGEAGGTVTATPIDSESSLEAAILVEMIAQGGSAAEANVVDLRSRVTSDLAVAVRIADARGDDVAAYVSVLASAVAAAQESELAVYSRAGLELSQSALFHAELEASQALDAALDAGSSSEEAYEAFFTARVNALTELGVDAEEQGRGEAAAGVSFRATVEARLSGEASAPVREAALLAAASLEARAQEQATLYVLAAGDASAEVTASATSAAAALRAQVSGAATAAAAAEAYASFATSVRGEGSVDGSILGAYIGADLLTAASLDAAVQASATAAAQLDAALDAAFEASLQTTGQIDSAALAAQVTAAYGAYFDALESHRAALAATTDAAHADAALSLLIIADGSFRL